MLEVRACSDKHISLRKSVVKELCLNENYVLLYRFSNRKNIYSLSKLVKITRSRNNEVNYKLLIQKDVLRKLNLNLPQSVSIEIIDKRKIGYKPKSEPYKNNILDLITLINSKKFTCFERPGSLLSIYLLNNTASCVATLPRYIKTDELCLWSLGFYLAEGLKTNPHRISVANNDANLIIRFINYLERYWGVNRRNISFRIRVKPENYSKSLKSYWSDKLNVNQKRIRVNKIYNKPTNAKYGNVEISVYNTILGTLHQKLLEKIPKLIKSKDECLAFIKGLEDGDGYPIEHSGRIEIGVIVGKEYTNFITSIYSKLYSKPIIEEHHTSDKVCKIYYNGLRNAVNFLLDNHFKEHVKRRGRLVRLIRKFMRRDLKYLKALYFGKRTVREISKSLGVTYRATNLMMKKYLSTGFIKMGYCKVNKRNREWNVRVFKFSDEGNKLVGELLNKEV